MAKKATGVVDQMYSIKITLMGSKPPIWRRVLTPSSFTLYKLHKVIQIAMGWTDNHLHQFIIDGEHYGIPSPDDWKPVTDERFEFLSKIASDAKRTFVYEYDFGDGWEHQILVEEISFAEPGVRYPACIAGQRACPPEDIGGVPGYEVFLQAIADPSHPAHAMYVDWIGGEFDPEAFSLTKINQGLRRVK